MNTQKIVLIVGYSKISYLKSLQSDPQFLNTTFLCAYTRRPVSSAKQSYLAFFSDTFDLSLPEDIAKLRHLGSTISAVTCTQERDMSDYIDVMLITCKITAPEHAQWQALCNKHLFKQTLRQHHPELVPHSHIVTKDTVPVLPAVVKPLGFTGSAFVSLITSPEAYHEYFEYNLIDTEEAPRTKQIQFVAEEYIAGPQYSINTYVSPTGKATFCPIIRVIPALELGIADNYSALQYVTQELNDTQTQQLHSAIEKIISIFSIKNTSAHFDAVYDGAGFKFFEVGLRIGGLRQEIFTETHAMNHFSNDIKCRLGDEIIIPPQKKSLCVIQKASISMGIIDYVSYTRSVMAENGPLLTEHKFRKFTIVTKPVKAGGGIVARFFMTGTDDEAVITASRRHFDAITITLQ